jgi:copper chaperone
MEKVTIKIEGMSCGGCVRNVTQTLEALVGVTGAEVSLDQACAIVQYDPVVIDERTMRQAVEEAGFDAPQ